MFDLNTSYTQKTIIKTTDACLKGGREKKPFFLHLKHVKIENVAILSKAWNFNGSLQMSVDLDIMPHMHCAFLASARFKRLPPSILLLYMPNLIKF